MQNYTSAQNCLVNNQTTDSFKRSILPKNVSFLGKIANISNEFEIKFTRAFFKKLLKEVVPDAYSDIYLIPLEELDRLKALGVLNKKSSVAIKALKEFKDDMFTTEKTIFQMLETMSKKNPDLTLQELIKLKFPQAELSLIKQQSNILNKINIVIRKLPQTEYKETRKIIQEAFDRILEPNPIPENRFRRKDFLLALKKLNINNDELKQRIIKIAEKLPRSSDNINAFIVKYSQPYKVKFNNQTQTYTRIPRDSQEIGLRLLEPSVGTDEHIYPQTKFNQEFKEWLEKEDSGENFNQLRVTILTSKYMNNLKTDIPLDDFIKEHPKLPNSIQNHVNRLIEIAEKWAQQGTLKEASVLCDYIKVLKNEFDIRSKIVKIDISKFETKIPAIKAKAQISLEKRKNKRLKKSGHADNSHKEHNTNKDGSQIENRKVQKHNSRFSK